VNLRWADLERIARPEGGRLKWIILKIHISSLFDLHQQESLPLNVPKADDDPVVIANDTAMSFLINSKTQAIKSRW
jgi:hypothetical protein